MATPPGNTTQTYVKDAAAPTISREVVADATANTAGFIKQGGTYFAYAQVTDSGSGVASVNADLNSTTTGASSVAMTTSGGPWTIGGNSYNYRSTLETANASLPESGNPYGFSINASDNASNSSIASSTVNVDNSGPTGGSVTINGLVGTGSLYKTSTSLSLSLSAGTDAGAGNAASSSFVLQRASTPLSSSDGIADGTCGSFGSFSTIATGPGASFTDSTGLASGNCYRYRYVVTDQLGNPTTYTSNVDAKIDASAPTVSSVTPSNASGNTFINGSTVWVNGQAGKSGAFDVAASASDSQSGILKVNFPAFGATGGTDDTSSPYSQHYTWSGSVTAGSKTVTATNNASLTGTGSFTVSSDTTNPTGGAITANGSGSNSFNTTGTVPLSATNFTDTGGSGIASNAITRASGTLTNGTCTGLSGATPVTISGGNDSQTLSSGCYQYTLTGTDNVGNTATATSAIVTVDIVAPSSSLTFPTTSGPFNATSWNAGASSSITGTASDASPSSGLANVKVSIQKVGGNYWNGTTFGSASEVKNTASGTANWTLAFAAANFATTGGGDGSYIVRVYASDAAGNTEATATSQTFVYDNTAPTVTITAPSGTSVTQPITYGGTAGNQSGDSSHSGDSTTVTVYVCSGTQSSCGASGPSLAQTLTATESGGNWSVTAASLATGTYTAQAQQSDGAGNTGKSSVDTFTTVASLTQTTAGSYTVTVAPGITSFGFTLKGAGGGGGGNTGHSGAAGGLVTGTITIPNSADPDPVDDHHRRRRRRRQQQHRRDKRI